MFVTQLPWWLVDSWGELDGEICETIPLRGDGMVVGKCPAEQEEQVIEAEVNMSLGGEIRCWNSDQNANSHRPWS